MPVRALPTCARAPSRASAHRSRPERVERRERRLEPGHTERRLLERGLLLVAGMWRMIGRDTAERAVPQRPEQRLAVASARSGGLIFSFASRVRTASSVRQRWCGVTSALTVTPRVARRPERATESDADTCMICRGRRSYAARAQSRSIIADSATDGQPARPSSADTAPSCICPSRERDGSSSCSGSRRPVTTLYCSARCNRPADDNGSAVVGEPGGPGVGELGHLGQLLAAQALRDRRHEADGHHRLLPRRFDQRAEHGGRVDDRIGVRHRQDGAVAAGRCRRGAARDRLLVLAARACAGGRADRRTQGPARARRRVRRARSSRGDDALLDRARRAARRRRSRDRHPGASDRERVERSSRANSICVSSVTPPQRVGDLDRAAREQVVEHRHAHDEPGAHLLVDQRRRRSRRRAGRSRRRGSSARDASPSGPARSRSGVIPQRPCIRAATARTPRPAACARCCMRRT